MAGSLEGPIAKLTRAELQVGVLQKEIVDAWSPDTARTVRTEIHRGGLEYRFYLDEPPEIKPSWGLITGEILFDLRSALDHLAWELHVRHYGRRTIPKNVEITSQFPICDTYLQMADSGCTRVKNLGKREQRAIRFLQPYQPRRDEWLSLVRVDLSILNTLHNIDKHRQLHTVVGAHHATVADEYPPEFGFQQMPVWGRVKPDGHVETWAFTQVPPEVRPHMGTFVQIALDDGEYAPSLARLLGRLTSSVALILRRFKGRFPPITPPACSSFTGAWWIDNRPRREPFIV